MLSSSTQVKIDGSKRARYFLRACNELGTHYNGPVKNNGTVTGFQVMKCRYIERSKNRPVWARQLLPVYDAFAENNFRMIHEFSNLYAADG